jgi:hypothetical protein
MCAYTKNMKSISWNFASGVDPCPMLASYLDHDGMIACWFRIRGFQKTLRGLGCVNAASHKGRTRGTRACKARLPRVFSDQVPDLPVLLFVSFGANLVVLTRGFGRRVDKSLLVRSCALQFTEDADMS